MKGLFILLFLFVANCCIAQHDTMSTIVFENPYPSGEVFFGNVSAYQGKYYLMEREHRECLVYNKQGKLERRLVFKDIKNEDTIRTEFYIPYQEGYLVESLSSSFIYLYDTALVCKKVVKHYGFKWNKKRYFVRKQSNLYDVKAVYDSIKKVFYVPVFARKKYKSQPLKLYDDEVGLIGVFNADFKLINVLGGYDDIYKSNTLPVNYSTAQVGNQLFVKMGCGGNVQVINLNNQTRQSVTLLDTITFKEDSQFEPYNPAFEPMNFMEQKKVELTIFNDLWITPSGDIIVTKSEAKEDTTTFRTVIKPKRGCAIYRQLDNQERLVLKKPGFVTVYSANGTKKFEQPTKHSNLKIVAVEGDKIYVQPRRLVPPTIYIINTTQQ